MKANVHDEELILDSPRLRRRGRYTVRFIAAIAATPAVGSSMARQKSANASSALRDRARRGRSMQAMRAAYFAAGETASCYGITFSDVVLHLWRARVADRRLRMRHMRHMDDLLQAIACVEGQPQAWTDLATRFERVLVRQCQPRLDAIEATVAVRQLFATLKRRSTETVAPSQACLRWYSGAKPLRRWLSDRLAAQLAVALDAAPAYGNVILELRPRGESMMARRTAVMNGSLPKPGGRSSEEQGGG